MTANPIRRLSSLLLASAMVVALWGDIVIRPSRTTSGKKKGGLIIPGAKGIEKAGPREQKILLLEGDTLRGAFLGYDADKGILWRHPSAQNEIQFRNSAVKSVILGKVINRPEAAQEETCSVLLRTGDEITGKLLEIDESKLYLDTWYAGTLAIPRDQVRSFSPNVGVSAAIYEGPTGTEGWSGRNLRNVEQQQPFIKQRGLRQLPQANGISGWGYQKNTFIAQGAGALISRKVEYPDKVRVDFDIQWAGYFQMEVGIMADNPQQYAGNGYVVGISRNNVYLYRLDNNNGRNNIGSHQLQTLMRKTRASISILVDKEQKNITLMIDGMLARQWKESGKFVGNGNLLKFVSQGTSQLRLSRIRVLEWDGQIPTVTLGQGAKITTDQAYMAKAGNVKGRLISIKDGQMTFYADSIDQDLNVPLKSIILVQLSGTEINELPNNDAGLTRLHFAHGGSVTVSLKAWDASQVSGESEALGGVVNFLPTAFSRVDFNLDKHSTELGDPLTGNAQFPVPQRIAPNAIIRR